MELNEKQFIAGFNSGYLLAEYEPQMLTTLLKDIQPLNSYVTGMSFGQKEYESFTAKSQLNELAQLRQKERMKKPEAGVKSWDWCFELFENGTINKALFILPC